jgi:hypothetical protein
MDAGSERCEQCDSEMPRRELRPIVVPAMVEASIGEDDLVRTAAPGCVSIASLASKDEPTGTPDACFARCVSTG